MNKIIISTLLLSFFSQASIIDEQNEWYLAKNGMYIIRDSINNGLIATLEKSRDGMLNIYIQYVDIDGCKEKNGVSSSHDPLYINGTLVKFAQACNNDWRTFYPISTEGTNHIIREFMRKSNVEVMTYDKSFKALFSAKGFTKIYDKKQKEITIENNAI
ncbi:hypothetical protein RF663_13965 [Aeromonas veronii]|uniref:hypothetical protein n=1 Tax=Aeromonas veronii TaxID=654 RepID=UPI0028530983|nr:hypothetical protein [Aeromonas veronii]MDR5015332.1 hypothetical protein [Aeromonas veronii]